jgi:hypothetical protein
VDAERTARTPLGKTIAHGLLTISMVGTVLKETTPVISDRDYLLAYGGIGSGFSPPFSGIRGFAGGSVCWNPRARPQARLATLLHLHGRRIEPACRGRRMAANGCAEMTHPSARCLKRRRVRSQPNGSFRQSDSRRRTAAVGRFRPLNCGSAVSGFEALPSSPEQTG